MKVRAFFYGGFNAVIVLFYYGFSA